MSKITTLDGSGSQPHEGAPKNCDWAFTEEQISQLLGTPLAFSDISREDTGVGAN